MKRPLTLCLPIVVFVFLMSSSLWATSINVAASANGGLASQSSTFNTFAGYLYAGYAIDGYTDKYRWPRSHTLQSTEADFGAWWEVSFNNSYLITEVELFNRLDCCSDRISPFSAILYSGNNIVWQVDGQTTQNNPNFTPDWIASPNATGDRLRIQLDGHANYLNMVQVEAFSGAQSVSVPEPTTLLALGLGLLAIAGMKLKRA